MPKVKSLTRREKRCLIDFDTISTDRHDYALILFCSRIIVRIQLKCFEELKFDKNDINDIVRKEANNFPEKLKGFAAQMRDNGYTYNLSGHENIMMLDFRHQIAYSENPLETIRNILNGELSSKPRNVNPPHVRRVYRNLINLTDDLQKYFVNRENKFDNVKKKHNIRPIYFLDNYFVYQEGRPGDDDESYISFPVALVWLPTLTISDEINQKNASAFYLRKKPEFLGKGVPTFRSQLLRMGLVQQRVKEGRNEKLTKNHKEKRQSSYNNFNSDSDQGKNPSCSAPPIKTLEPPISVTSIQAILNHVDDKTPPAGQRSLWPYNLSTRIPPNLNECRICSSSSTKMFDFRTLCPCIKNKHYYSKNNEFNRTF